MRSRLQVSTGSGSVTADRLAGWAATPQIDCDLPYTSVGFARSLVRLFASSTVCIVATYGSRCHCGQKRIARQASHVAGDAEQGQCERVA